MKRLMIFTLVFFLTGFILAEKVATLSGLTRPFYIMADDNQLYITDGPTINIYSLKDYKLVKRFGKAGEGPQEFKLDPRRAAGSVNIFIHPDYILANSQAKVSYFTKKGEFIKELRTEGSQGLRFQPLGNQFAGEGFDADKNFTYNIRNTYDSKFQRGKELYRRKTFMQEGVGLNPFYMVSPIMHVYQNKVFINDSEELKIYVFDQKGDKINTITHKYDYLVITDESRDKMLNWYKTSRSFKQFYHMWKDRLKFPKYFPAIRWYHIVDNKAYVLTYKKEAEKSEFYILDIKGKFLKNVMVPLAEKDDRLWYPYVIKNGKLYQLIENSDEEEWELHVTVIK